MSEARFGSLPEPAMVQEASRVAAGAILMGKVGGEKQAVLTDKGSGPLQIMR